MLKLIRSRNSTMKSPPWRAMKAVSLNFFLHAKKGLPFRRRITSIFWRMDPLNTLLPESPPLRWHCKYLAWESGLEATSSFPPISLHQSLPPLYMMGSVGKGPDRSLSGSRWQTWLEDRPVLCLFPPVLRSLVSVESVIVSDLLHLISAKLRVETDGSSFFS